MNDELTALHRALGIPENYSTGRPVFAVEAELVAVGPDCFGRPQRLHPTAAQAWVDMKQAAAAQNITLQLVSCFRNYEYQAGIIRRKLEKGESLESILKAVAAPGFSEHHTGRAIDISTQDIDPLTEDFETTEAFSWLTEHGSRFGFHMSFPRGNPWGYIYEPWHWAIPCSFRQ